MQPLQKTKWSFLKRLKIELPYDQAIPLLGIHVKKMKTIIQKDISNQVFIAALLTLPRYRSSMGIHQQMNG